MVMTKKDADTLASNLNRNLRRRKVRDRRYGAYDTGQKGKGVLSKLPKEATGTRFDVKPIRKLKKPTKRVKGFAEGGTKMSNKFTGKTSGASTLALRRRGLDKGRRDMLNTFKEAKRIKKSGRMTLDDIKAVEKRKRATAGKNASAKTLDKRGLDKTKRATANKNKQVRDKLKITKFMKRGGKAK